MTLEKFNFFENFKYLLMGGHDEKLKNFGKSKKKSVIFTNQTISSKKFFLIKNFKIETANVIFRTIFNESEIFFWSIAQIEHGFQKLGHWVTKTVRLKSFESSRWPRKLTLKSRLGSAHGRKNFKLAPIRKRFRYSESVSLRDQKSPPHHFPNPQSYRDTTN